MTPEAYEASTSPGAKGRHPKGRGKGKAKDKGDTDRQASRTPRGAGGKGGKAQEGKPAKGKYKGKSKAEPRGADPPPAGRARIWTGDATGSDATNPGYARTDRRSREGWDPADRFRWWRS